MFRNFGRQLLKTNTRRLVNLSPVTSPFAPFVHVHPNFLTSCQNCGGTQHAPCDSHPQLTLLNADCYPSGSQKSRCHPKRLDEKRCQTCKVRCGFDLKFQNYAHISVPICQNTFSPHLVKQRYGHFQFSAYFTSVCQGKSTKAPEKCSPIGESLWGTIFHALGKVFRLFRGVFVQFLR